MSLAGSRRCRFASGVWAGPESPATGAVDEAAGQVLGVNSTDQRCLDILDHHGQMSAGELARHSRLTTGAVTAVIDRLERAGYVQRTADSDDRRRVLVELTPAARQASWELFGPLAEAAGPLLAATATMSCGC